MDHLMKPRLYWAQLRLTEVDTGSEAHAMNSNVTISVFAVIAIFAFGVAVGCIIATVRVRGSVRIGFPPADIQQGTAIPRGVRFIKSVNTATVRSLTLKCG